MIADAHRNGNRFIVRADEKLTAFLEVESAIRARAERPEDCGALEIKIDKWSRNMYKPSRLPYPTVSTYLRPGLKTPWGWIFAETPFSAIPQIQLEPRVSRMEAALLGCAS
jgi:hypothetical protein